MKIPEIIQNRFFNKIQMLKKKKDDDPTDEYDDCWLWLGYIMKNGYGQLKMNGVAHLAHRISYQIVHETDIPYYLCVHHKCRRKHCVNPDHLQLTTYSVNNYDSYLEHRLEE